MTIHSPSLALYLSLGIEAKLDNINQLKVKGLVLGPLHTVQPNQPSTLNFEDIDPTKGTKKALTDVLEKAHKKGRLSTVIVRKAQTSTRVEFILSKY